MKPQFCCVFIWICAVAEAAAPAGYYADAEGKSGPSLRAALHRIISHHTVIPYAANRTDISDALAVLDRDPGNSNNVILIDSGRSQPASSFGLVQGWNPDHLWPNSYGLDNRAPAYSDLFNLRAIDATVNSARGNKYFDDSNPGDSRFRSPAHAEAHGTSTDSDSWEPPRERKGDIARALFYMDVRYGGAGEEPNLELTDRVELITSEAAFMGVMTTLVAWNRADPVDAAERRRNDEIFEKYQHNRNPFVDHPEWVEAVFIVPRLQTELRLVQADISHGILQFMIVGASWQTNIVQTSLDLSTWVSIRTNAFYPALCPMCPFIIFQDAVTNAPKRFYRAVNF